MLTSATCWKQALASTPENKEKKKRKKKRRNSVDKKWKINLFTSGDPVVSPQIKNITDHEP